MTLLCLMRSSTNWREDELPESVIWLFVIRGTILTEITPRESGSIILFHIFLRETTSIRTKCKLFPIFCRFSVDLIPIRPWNYSKIWWNGCWIRLVIRIIFKSVLSRRCLNWANDAFSLQKFHRYTTRSVKKAVSLNVLLSGLVISLGFRSKKQLQQVSEW